MSATSWRRVPGGLLQAREGSGSRRGGARRRAGAATRPGKGARHRRTKGRYRRAGALLLRAVLAEAPSRCAVQGGARRRGGPVRRHAREKAVFVRGRRRPCWPLRQTRSGRRRGGLPDPRAAGEGVAMLTRFAATGREGARQAGLLPGVRQHEGAMAIVGGLGNRCRPGRRAARAAARDSRDDATVRHGQFTTADPTATGRR